MLDLLPDMASDFGLHVNGKLQVVRFVAVQSLPLLHFGREDFTGGSEMEIILNLQIQVKR